MQNDYSLTTTSLTFTGAKVELTTVEEWTKAEKESILQESAKTTTKAGKLPLMKMLPSQHIFTPVEIKLGKLSLSSCTLWSLVMIIIIIFIIVIIMIMMVPVITLLITVSNWYRLSLWYHDVDHHPRVHPQRSHLTPFLLPLPLPLCYLHHCNCFIL